MSSLPVVVTMVLNHYAPSFKGRQVLHEPRQANALESHPSNLKKKWRPNNVGNGKYLYTEVEVREEKTFYSPFKRSVFDAFQESSLSVG